MKPRLALLLLAASLALGSPPLGAQPLGRLFYTPAERAQLDAGKFRTPAAAGSLTYQGQVRRSQGPATIWVDGQPGTASPPEGAQVGDSIGSPGGDLLRGGRITVHPAGQRP